MVLQENQVSIELEKEISELKEINKNLFDLSVDYRSDKIIESRNFIYVAIRELEAVYAEMNTVSEGLTAIPI